MSQYEQKPGTFTLFPVSEKKSEKAPDYKGKINIEGKVFELSGWKKQGQKGIYLSGQYKEFYKGKANTDDLPF